MARPACLVLGLVAFCFAAFAAADDGSFLLAFNAALAQSKQEGKYSSSQPLNLAYPAFFPPTARLIKATNPTRRAWLGLTSI